MESLSEKKKLVVVGVLMVVMFFASINQTLVSNSMPRIIAILGGMDYYSWVLTSFLLASCISTIVVGKLSDIYGRKPFLLAGIVIFVLGTFLCGMSKNIFQMIGFRVIQGMGAGVLMSSTITAVGDLFAPRERAKWTGSMMAIFGFSSIVGPTLGGFMIDHMEWHWLFWTFLPLGIVAFVMIWSLFPDTERQRGQSIDYWGSFVLSVGIMALLLGFSWAGNEYPWNSKEIIGLFSLVAVCAIVFFFIERKAANPVLPLSLFKNQTVMISSMIGFLMNAAMMGTMMYLPFFIQGVEGLSPSQSGMVNIPMSLIMVSFSTLTGRWISSSGAYKKYGIAGILLMLVGMALMSLMNSVPFAIMSICVFGVGLGMCMPILTLVAQNAVPASQLGVVTAASTLFRNLGSTIGIAVFGSVMSTSLKKKIEAGLASGAQIDFANLEPQAVQQLTEYLNPEILLDQPKLKGMESVLSADMYQVFLQVIDFLRVVLHESISIVFLSGAGLIAIASIMMFLLKEIPLRTSNDAVANENQTL